MRAKQGTAMVANLIAHFSFRRIFQVKAASSAKNTKPTTPAILTDSATFIMAPDKCRILANVVRIMTENTRRRISSKNFFFAISGLLSKCVQPTGYQVFDNQTAAHSRRLLMCFKLKKPT